MRRDFFTLDQELLPQLDYNGITISQTAVKISFSDSLVLESLLMAVHLFSLVSDTSGKQPLPNSLCWASRESEPDSHNDVVQVVSSPKWSEKGPFRSCYVSSRSGFTQRTTKRTVTRMNPLVRHLAHLRRKHSRDVS